MLTEEQRSLIEQWQHLIPRAVRRFRNVWRSLDEDNIATLATNALIEVAKVPREIDNFETFFFWTLRRRVKDELAYSGIIRTKRLSRVEFVGEILPDKHTATGQVDADDFVASALSHLDERDAYIVRRIAVDGWTQTEVAKELGCGQPRVCGLYNRALAKLREVVR